MIFRSFLMHMKRSLAVVLAAALLFGFVSPLNAQESEETCKGLVFLNTWARPAIEGTNTAVYGLIVNLGDEDEMLTAVNTDAAAVVELHESSMADDGMMEMHPLEGGLHIPAHGTALLEPGGAHMMVIDLADTLETETTIDLELAFMNAGDINLEVPVGESEEPTLQAFNVEHCDTVGLWGAWARPVELENSNGAIYGVLLNLTDEDDVLVEVMTDAAQVAELHESVIQDDGTMHMSLLEEGIELAAGSFVLLEPGGTHIMLIDIEKPLAEGDMFEIELHFETAELLPVMVSVTDDASHQAPMTHTTPEHLQD